MFKIEKDGFYLNGKKFRLFSGAMHYFRVLPEYWDDRFQKMKACGFNAVETVMCWNLHEKEEGKFDFSGILDIVRFCKTAEKYGMYVLLRPGPYTCGEWDGGGFPAWLIKDKNIRLRCNDKTFLEKVKGYFNEVFRLVAPLQVTRGGNILAFQIENEYGSYGNDKDYLRSLQKIMQDAGAEVPFFTSDGNNGAMLSGGTLPDVYKTLNFGSHASTAFNALDAFQKDLPKTCMEFWCGWFDHWGRIHHKRNPVLVEKEVRALVNQGANLNIYMFHGGTNFGFYAGANYVNSLLPVVTSYDDAALLNEYGDYTKAYHRVRNVLHEAQNLPLQPLPKSPVLQNIGAVNLTEIADLWGNFDNLGEKHFLPNPETIEYFGQPFGHVLYRTTVKGIYPRSVLFIEEAHDIVYVKVDGKLLKRYDRTRNRNKKCGDGFKVIIPPINGECKIEIFVEGMGRINYGKELCDKKGIGRVLLGSQILFGWEIVTLPFNNLDKTDFSKKPNGIGAILKGHFSADTEKDCFVDMRGFKKGFVLINGFNIGRYWEEGPQWTLYLPAPLLKSENEIIVVEQESYKTPVVTIRDKHLL